jgi:hypothetical protein
MARSVRDICRLVFSSVVVLVSATFVVLMMVPGSVVQRLLFSCLAWIEHQPTGLGCLMLTLAYALCVILYVLMYSVVCMCVSE